jgi:hypothetical protein
MATIRYLVLITRWNPAGENRRRMKVAVAGTAVLVIACRAFGMSYQDLNRIRRYHHEAK